MPMPLPPANPRVLAFLQKKVANSLGWVLNILVKCPAVEAILEANAPPRVVRTAH